jgi:glycosyltransferase involved in cell wall biosynthesis
MGDRTVSVIIPCYKQAHFLPQAIESVLAQSQPAEIIVVDDGSPDNTAEVAARYPGVRCLRQDNRGLAEARNSGFRASSGNYVIFLDADDRLALGAIEAHLRCFADHPEAGFVVGDIDHISADGSYLDSPRWPILERNFYEELLRVNHVANTIAIMFRREVLESIGGFDRSCSPAEDYRLLLQAARSYPSAHHSTVVAQYRRHQATLSRRGVLMLRAMHQVMELERPFVHGHPEWEKAHREGVRYWRDHFGRTGLREVFAHLVHGRVLTALRILPGLVWYARGQLLVLPWKYRRRILRKIHARFGMSRPNSKDAQKG